MSNSNNADFCVNDCEILLVIDNEVIREGISSKHTGSNSSCLFSVDSCIAKHSCRQFPLSFRIHSRKVRMDLSPTLPPACKVVPKDPSSHHSPCPLFPSIFHECWISLGLFLKQAQSTDTGASRMSSSPVLTSEFPPAPAPLFWRKCDTMSRGLLSCLWWGPSSDELSNPDVGELPSKEPPAAWNTDYSLLRGPERKPPIDVLPKSWPTQTVK